jgi:chemotaxis protein histidine kinase CheA
VSNPWEKPGRERRDLPEQMNVPVRRRVGPWESAAAPQEDYPLDMLRRLEGEDDDPGVSEFSPYQRSVSGEPLDEVPCPGCHSSNPRFHRYCGYCGAALDGTSAIATDDFSRVPELHAGSASEQPVPRQESSRTPQAEAEGLRSFSPAAPAAESPDSHRDLSFLREQSFTSFDTPPRRRRAWQYLALLLLLGLAGFGYWKWTVARQNASAEQYLREQADVTQNSPDQSLTSQSAAQSRSTASSNPSLGQQAAAPAAKAPQAPITNSIADSKRSIPNPAATSQANEETAREAATAASRSEHDRADREASKKTAREPASQANASAAPSSGIQELATARHYLEGPNRNPSEAARWLWRAVSKQNSEASLLLANLYLRGDGVSRSCEQGRLLLVTAAKKGVSGAAAQLRNLESTGCH